MPMMSPKTRNIDNDESKDKDNANDESKDKDNDNKDNVL